MLNKVIHDIYHLRRVHAVLPDAVLGDTLKNKLLRLSLQPSLQELKHQTPQLYTGGQVGTNVSSPVSAGRWGHGGGALVSSPYTMSPSALCHLLDSLAYFHLGSSAVATEAVQLVRLSAPFMSVPQLCTTLAACCALGAQTDITAAALPLLSTALNFYTGAPLTVCDGAMAGSAVGSHPPSDASLLFSQGGTVLLLMEALQRAGVEEVQVWHLLAEHCLRHLDSFDGKQLCGAIAVLCAEGIDDYPDFFVAAERHITSQPSNYLSPDQLQKVVQCYKDLNQPVVSLLALINATPVHGEDVESSLSAAAAAVTFSKSNSSSSFGGASKGNRALSGSSEAARVAELHPSLEAFEGAAITAVTSADAQGVLNLLQKCEQKRVMTARVMDAVLERLLALYYPELLCVAACTVWVDSASTSAGTVPDLAVAPQRRHAPLELHHLSQSLLTAFEFSDVTLFSKQLPAAASPGVVGSSPAAVTRSAVVTVLLEALGAELSGWYHHRVLQLVPYALRLLPTPSQPRIFYRAVIDHLRRSNDLSSHEGLPQLRSSIDALLALRDYGGESILVQYMPAITVAVQNAPRSAQLELTALLAHLPCAKEELIPGVYRQWGSQKRWLRTITEEEVGWALQIMSRSSGVRDSQVLHAVLEYVQAQQAQLPPHRVVDYLHQLARLGVRDLEFFAQTAEQLMRRAVESTSCSSAAFTTRSSTARPAHGSSSSQMMVRHQQWQVTTVHDLCLLLFTFTFVLRDSIRVTQQIISRLKMCVAVAAPRDISLALYSFVKLRVTHNDDLIGQLCDRASATLSDFRASELVSVWSSLRCLRHAHEHLRQRTLELLRASEADTCPRWRFADNDCVSLGSALLLTEALPSVNDKPLVPPPLRRGITASGETDEAAAAALPETTATKEEGLGVAAQLPPTFRSHFVKVCQRLLPASTGQRLYLILCSLGHCLTSLSVTPELWSTLVSAADTHAESLSTGALGELPGVTALEVLLALRRLHSSMEDLLVLPTTRAAAGSVPKLSTRRKGSACVPDSESWVAPYCPPGLWAVLRPHWRGLTRSVDLVARPALMEIVSDISGPADVSAAAPEPKVKRQSSGAPVKKSAVRKGSSTKVAVRMV